MQLASGTTIRHTPRTPAVTPVQVTKGEKGADGAPGGSDASFAAFVTDPASLTRAGLSATYVPKWKPNTAYAAGERVVNPSGDIVLAKTAFTSGATYSSANWSLPATYAPAAVSGTGMLTRQTLVTLGDSLTAHADDIDSTAAFKSYRGIWTWAEMQMGFPLQWVKNAGVPGDTTAMILARFDTDVAAYSPGVVALLAGTNDVTNAVPLATTQANMEELLARIRGIGALCVLSTIPPRTADDVTLATARTTYNNWLRNTLANRPGVFFVDFNKALAAGGTAYANAAYTWDGIHLTARGAEVASRPLIAALDGVLPKRDPLHPATFLDGNLLANPYMTGGTTTATSWTKADSGGAITTASKVPRTDGLPGEWQQVTTTTEGGGTRIYQRVPVPASVAVGAKVYAIAEFETSNDWSSVDRFRLNVLGLRADFTTSYGSRFGMLNGGDPYPNDGTADIRPRKGIMSTRGVPLTVPADATNIEVAVEFDGLGTYRMGRMGLWVAP